MSSAEGIQAGNPAGTEAPGPSGSFARILSGLIVLLLGFVAWREVEPILLFRPVDGVVVWSGIESSYVFIKRGHRHYAAGITYRYKVNGESFLSSQYRRTNMVGSHSEASRRTGSYIVGARVPAWYNPLNPADSVLSREPDPLLFVILGVLGVGVWRFSRATEQSRYRTRHGLASGPE